MSKTFPIGVILAAILIGASSGSAEGASQAAAAGTTPNDYSDGKSWLCRPGRHDACDVDLRTTFVAADGRLTQEKWSADGNAPIDCFYVYPTVSTDTTPNSDMNADAAELNVVRQQLALIAAVRARGAHG